MLSVREMENRDIQSITDYWIHASDAHLLGMGVDLAKMPAADQWHTMLSQQLQQPYTGKQSYCMIWELDGTSIGHCNVNKIVFGEEAYMHLHLWQGDFRLQGKGSELVKMSLPYFFKNLELKQLYCEPYALNPAPNKTLAKVGFTFVKELITIPGMLNFEQLVNLWQLRKTDFEKMIS